MSIPPPLRFLGAVLGGWTCLRVAMLAPGWAGSPGAPPLPQSAPPPLVHYPTPSPAGGTPGPIASVLLPISAECGSCGAPARPAVHPVIFEPPPLPTLAAAVAAPAGPPSPAAPVPLFFQATPVPSQSALLARLPEERRWSSAAWAFVRQGDAQSLAAGGTLGGSQLGARFAYRINGNPQRPLALNLRLSSPLRSRKGAEAALGLEWKPVAAVPVRLLAERRQALGDEGRSAFALLAYGGVSDLKALGPLRVSAYAQAGVVGVRSRDLFADGAAVIALPLDEGERMSVGAGAWAAAQPGVSRLDVGPSVRLRLPVQGRSVSVSADWRIRAAGDAAPGSGPALTVATDF